MNNTSVHLHLYYEDAGSYLLKKLSKIWNGKIYLSLVHNNCANDILLSLANSIFSDIDIVYVDNKGTDQYGFLHSFKLNNEDTKWILYWHDKHLSKKQWLDDLTDLFCIDENIQEIKRYTNDISSCGIISSAKCRNKALSFHQIAELSPYMAIEYRQNIVRSYHAIIWLKELQYLFKQRYNLYDENEIYPEFSAGTVFLARRDIVAKAHSVVHDNYFEDCYRADGDVGHALERFYHYVSKCLGYTNKFI
jgi:hypothetical protein